MARRRLTIKRLDPWSVLKFGAVANLVLLAIFLLVMGVVWYIVERLQLVDQVCGIATDVGFTTCGINAGNLFRATVLLGLLWTVVQTAILVFLAFLHNLIADLTGGLVIGVVDDTPVAREQAATRRAATTGATGRTGGAPSQPMRSTVAPGTTGPGAAGGDPPERAAGRARRTSAPVATEQPGRQQAGGDEELFADR